MPAILVLDDEPLIAAMLQEWLTELGCETVGPAATVAAALELASKTPMDAAILDVTVGEDDCFAVADVLRARQIPFAFATGHGASGVEARFADVPVLQKPYLFEQVGALTEKLCGRT